MMQRRYGKIISIGSVAGLSGQPGATVSVYGGTKGAVISLSKALAYELGPYGININVVCPGVIVPRDQEEVGESSTWSKWALDFYTSDKLESMLKGVPMRRPGKAEDIADMVVFLASDRASYVTGQAISVSGGISL